MKRSVISKMATAAAGAGLLLPLLWASGRAGTTGKLTGKVIDEQKAKGRIKGMFSAYLAPTVVNTLVDPTFGFMTVDRDGKIRMDCSSPYAMASLIGLKDKFAVAFGNDADSDRHGIVTRGAGLLNPNHYLSAAR